jgi:hypothetical protein
MLPHPAPLSVVQLVCVASDFRRVDLNAPLVAKRMTDDTEREAAVAGDQPDSQESRCSASSGSS